MAERTSDWEKFWKRIPALLESWRGQPMLVAYATSEEFREKNHPLPRNVSLTPQLEAMIHAKVESGLYNNASEVVREALRIMEQREREDRLHYELSLGLKQVEEGKTVPYTPELHQRLEAEAVRRAIAGEPISDVINP